MWNILKRTKPWPIGLAIAHDGIRMLQLHSSDGRLAVLAGAQWLTGQTGEGAVNAVREVLREGNFEGKGVVSSIGNDEIHLRSIRLPIMSQEELHKSIASKASDMFGFDVSLSQLQVLGSAPVIMGDESCQEVIVAAVPNYAIRRRRELLEKMGLTGIAIEIEPLAVFRGFHRLLRRGSDKHALNVLVNVSPTSTLVLVAHGADILFIKNIERGGQQLSQAASEQLGLSIEDAQQLRQQLKMDLLQRTRSLGQVQPVPEGREKQNPVFWSVYDAVRTEADALVLEIGLCLRYCSTTFGCEALRKITMTGQEAWDPSLLHLLGERLGLRCEIVQPFRDIDVSKSRIFRDRRGMLTDWTTCIGLASWAESSETVAVLDVAGSYVK